MPRAIFENIVIQHFEETTFFEFCQYTSIRFFEIIHLKKGEGTLKINGNAISYTPNSFFVFIPDDIYTITVDKPTTVTTIKFLKSFFTANSVSQTKDWFRKIEVSLNNRDIIEELQFQSKSDKRNLISLVEILRDEAQEYSANDSIIFQNTLSTILHIISRNSCPNSKAFLHLKSKT